MHTDRKLRIAIDCRISDSHLGIGTAVLSLAKALSDSKISDQEYTFIVREDMRDWLEPYIYGPCKLVGIPASRLSFLKKVLRPIAPLRFLWQKARSKVAHVPVSDGYIESHGFDLVHFPTPMAYLTDVPSIYQPWDLQHLHYPHFFSKADFEERERHYPAFCEQAAFVCVQTEWTRGDIMQRYRLAADKIAVIPWGSVFDAYKTPSTETIRATVAKYNLPEQFFFYPAATWPHKNHEAIFRAVHILKSERGTSAHVYFSGSSKGHRVVLDKLATDLGISDQVHFLGFLAPEDLQAVFSAATAMVFASKFEGFGLPILEAFHAGLPLISSNATTLPEVAGDAALYFDPDLPAELASLMKTVLDAPEMRAELIRKGALMLLRHTIRDTASGFQSLYEKTFALSSQEDRLSPVSTAI
jgi:glycosyltransferase involved in cell wall biosynthesis